MCIIRLNKFITGGGAIIRKVVPVRDSSEDGYFDVVGAFVFNDLMRRAGKSR